MEGLIPKDFGQDAVEVLGARDLLASLVENDAPWAMYVFLSTKQWVFLMNSSVTSGTRALCTGWLDVMKMDHPRHLVVAEDVSVGKPGKAMIFKRIAPCEGD